MEDDSALSFSPIAPSTPQPRSFDLAPTSPANPNPDYVTPNLTGLIFISGVPANIIPANPASTAPDPIELDPSGVAANPTATFTIAALTGHFADDPTTTVPTLIKIDPNDDMPKPLVSYLPLWHLPTSHLSTPHQPYPLSLNRTYGQHDRCHHSCPTRLDHCH